MGTSISYNSVNCPSDEVRRDAVALILSLSEEREWWAESMLLFEMEESPLQIYGDTKLFCMDVNDEAADCYMAMMDAEFIVGVLELTSKQFGINWEIQLAGSPAGGVQAGLRTPETNELRAIFEAIAEASLVDFSNYDRQTLLKLHTDR